MPRDPRAEETEDALRRFRVTPDLRAEFRKIGTTPTGSRIIDLADERDLRRIRAGRLRGGLRGVYRRRLGVITIAFPNKPWTFQVLVHELEHAAGLDPHGEDEDLVARACREAGARYYPLRELNMIDRADRRARRGARRTTGGPSA